MPAQDDPPLPPERVPPPPVAPEPWAARATRAAPSQFDAAPPFRRRRNPLKLWTWAAGIFAVLAAGTINFAQGEFVMLPAFMMVVALHGGMPLAVAFAISVGVSVLVLGWLFKLAKAIPIAPQKEDPQAYEAAFREAAQVLCEGDLLGIFPEGGITRDGTLQPFKGGIAKILAQAQADGVPVSVVPMALTNLWGSYFSRIERGTAMVRPFRRGMFSRVGLNVGARVAASEVQPEPLRGRVAQLLQA